MPRTTISRRNLELIQEHLETCRDPTCTFGQVAPKLQPWGSKPKPRFSASAASRWRQQMGTWHRRYHGPSG